MCGRYSIIDPDQISQRFKTKNNLPLFKSQYNATPGMELPVITQKNNTNEITLMKWGLVPFWAKDPSIGYKMINARSETLADKPSFKKALISKRCLIPASGFYEWKIGESQKIPYYIHLPHSPIFAFAGLYDSWKDASDNELKTYTIITTTPNNLLAPIHNRMPVILNPSWENFWLNPNEKDLPKLTELLKPFEEKDLEAYPVSNLVNHPENNNKDLIIKSSLF